MVFDYIFWIIYMYLTQLDESKYTVSKSYNNLLYGMV